MIPKKPEAIGKMLPVAADEGVDEIRAKVAVPGEQREKGDVSGREHEPLVTLLPMESGTSFHA
jgi:hypothetical protein